MIQNTRHTEEYIKTYYNDYGYTLLDIYSGVKKKNNVLCPKGHDFQVTFDNFNHRKSRCPICAGKQKLTHEEVNNYYTENGYELKSIYINIKTKDSLICPEGHEIQMRFLSFKHHNSRCNVCYRKNNFGKNHHNWNPDRTRKRRLYYLCFDLSHVDILKNDPNYQDYLINPELYHIDHIYPRKAFIDHDIDKKYGLILAKQFCNDRENLRIISKEENLNKSSKYDEMEFLFYIQRKVIDITIQQINN